MWWDVGLGMVSASSRFAKGTMLWRRFHALSTAYTGSLECLRNCSAQLGFYVTSAVL